MSNDSFSIIEQGIRMAQARAAVLSSDTANARTPGFVPSDLAGTIVRDESGVHFAATLHEVGARGPSGTIEYAMGATAQNSVRFRALADQERAIVREFKTVAEESRR
jgi:flagellar basal body rod protein FlgB